MNKQIGNVQLMQKINRLKVLNFIRKNPDTSRPAISQATGLSLASITNVTAYLIDLGLVSECGTENVERVGRKSTLLRFCATSYNLICVAISKHHMNIAYTDLEGNIIKNICVNTDKMSPDKVMASVREKVAELLETGKKERVLGIGVAISGLVLDDSRFVLSTSHKWKEFDIKKILEEDTSLPVFIDNISLLKAVWYFYCSGAEEADNMLFIDMENGIGAAQFYEGAISRAMLGEFGHTTIEKNGEPCFCGNRGCLEAMCSPGRILSLYESASGKKADSLKQIEKLYKKGDKSATIAISECGKYLGIGLANLINLFNPSAFIFNTGDFTDCPSLFKEAEQELYERAAFSVLGKVKIIKICETEEDTICGTASNLCDRLFKISFPESQK